MSENLVGRSVLGSVKPKRTEVYIEEWDGSICIKQLTHGEKSQIDALALDMVDPAKRTIRDKAKLSQAGFLLIKLSWIDGDGAFVLEDADYSAIQAEPDVIIDKILRAIREWNGMTDDAKQAAKKNLEASPNGVSGISSL